MINEDLARVKQSIGDSVLAFVKGQLAEGKRTFRMADLSKHVEGFRFYAPDSPGRILRALRREGKINYRVIDRSSSLYELLT